MHMGGVREVSVILLLADTGSAQDQQMLGGSNPLGERRRGCADA